VRISEFDYDLPPELIAQEPLPERDASRLMVLERATGAVSHRRVSELPELLAPGDLLVMNRSRVLPARLRGRLRGGGAAEVLLLRPAGGALWDAFVRPGRRLKPGASIECAADLRVRVESGALPPDGRRRVRVLSEDDALSAIERHGEPPLPPYIKRRPSAADRERYQTVYAREAGSVAAPTAGLHFGERLLARLAARHIARTEVVLHVGPGTFQPVKVEQVEDHRVAPEPFEVPREAARALARARAAGTRVVAVGTTSVRCLETAASDDRRISAGRGETALVIAPGFAFRVVDALLTNFHLPRSSLLLLVAAFAGRETVLAAYREAVKQRYRFYSYGDAMLIL
jgi:S-adenosylmethionine:tRNA ribosyltransferase-isomerase